ncbi:hypothetical protein J6590_011652 [Homalodisca vitripennis]|nr:hypothetical protein J6590_011652 [Homalodisca vitripennis]
MNNIGSPVASKQRLLITVTHPSSCVSARNLRTLNVKNSTEKEGDSTEKEALRIASVYRTVCKPAYPIPDMLSSGSNGQSLQRKVGLADRCLNLRVQVKELVTPVYITSGGMPIAQVFRYPIPSSPQSELKLETAERGALVSVICTFGCGT